MSVKYVNTESSMRIQTPVKSYHYGLRRKWQNKTLSEVKINIADKNYNDNNDNDKTNIHDKLTFIDDFQNERRQRII